MNGVDLVTVKELLGHKDIFANRKPTIFLSYVRKDVADVKALYQKLKSVFITSHEKTLCHLRYDLDEIKMSPILSPLLEITAHNGTQRNTMA
jgi:hypothetical protein